MQCWKRVSPVQDESPAIKPSLGHLFGRRHGGGVRDVHIDQPITENPEFKAMQERMLNLENALT